MSNATKSFAALVSETQSPSTAAPVSTTAAPVNILDVDTETDSDPDFSSFGVAEVVAVLAALRTPSSCLTPSRKIRKDTAPGAPVAKHRRVTFVDIDAETDAPVDVDTNFGGDDEDVPCLTPIRMLSDAVTPSPRAPAKPKTARVPAFAGTPVRLPLAAKTPSAPLKARRRRVDMTRLVSPSTRALQIAGLARGDPSFVAAYRVRGPGQRLFQM